MKKSIAGLLVVITAVLTSVATLVPAESEEMETERLHITEYLAFKNIPGNEYLLLFDSTPDAIASGHLAIKANCDTAGDGKINVLLGVAPDMKATNLDKGNMVSELSSPGKMCLYHIDLPPEQDMLVTDVAISNPSEKNVRLGPTASITIYVKSFGESVGHHDEHDEPDHS